MAARKRNPINDPISDEALALLSTDYAIAPDLPLEIASREFGALGRAALKHVRALTQVGLKKEQVDLFVRGITRLADLEKAWQSARKRALPTTRRSLRDEADALRKRLFAAAGWAFRYQEEHLQELGRVRDGASLADTLAELRDLVAFWRKHQATLLATNVSVAELNHATRIADELDASALEEGAYEGLGRTLDLRNRCFWMMDEMAREIREYGRYAFSCDPKNALLFTARFRPSVRVKPKRRNRSSRPPHST